MSKHDEEIVEKILEAAKYLRPNSPMTQKELASYMGLDAKKLSEWIIKSKRDRFTAEQLGKLLNTLSKFEDGSFEKRLAITVADIHVETVQKSLPQVKLDFYMSRMQLTDLMSFVAPASSIICIPDGAFRIKELLATLFVPGAYSPEVNLLISNQHLSETINGIEQWAYGAGGNFSDCLTLNLYVGHAETAAGMIGCTIDGEFFGFVQDKDETDFIRMPDAESEDLKVREQSLVDEECAWQLLRTPEAREIRRFLRSPAAEKLTDDVVQFLERKIVDFEGYRKFDATPSENILENLEDEIEGIFDQQMAQQFSRQLYLYWLALERQV